MNAHLFAEALAAFAAVCHAVAVWLVVGAVVATAGLLGGIAAVVWVVRGVWRAGVAVAALRTNRTAPLADEQPVSDSEAAGATQRLSGPPSRPAPTWTHADTDDQPEIEEAA